MKKLTNKTGIISFFILSILAVSGCVTTDQNVQLVNITRFNNTTTHINVEIRSLFYAPPIVSIANGTTVAWTNKDSIQHTVTSMVGTFDSGAINTDATYSYTFNQTGAFEYSCTIHKDMPHGLVIVR